MNRNYAPQMPETAMKIAQSAGVKALVASGATGSGIGTAVVTPEYYRKVVSSRPRVAPDWHVCGLQRQVWVGSVAGRCPPRPAAVTPPLRSPARPNGYTESRCRFLLKL